MQEINYQLQLDSQYNKVKGQSVSCNTKDHQALIRQRNPEESSNLRQSLNSPNNCQRSGCSKAKNMQSHCSLNTHLSKYNSHKTKMNCTGAT